MNNRIKEFREAASLSQGKLAELLGVSRQTINSLEKGRYNPSIELAFKCSLTFKKPIEEIFIYEGEKDNG